MSGIFVNDVLSLGGARLRLLLIRFPGQRVLGPTNREVREALTNSKVLEGGGAYYINIDKADCLPERWNLTQLQSAIQGSEVVPPSELPQFARPPVEKPSDEAKKKTRLDRLKPVLWHPDIWEPVTRGPLLKARAIAAGCSYKTLMADLRLWFVGGQNAEALCGNYFCSGHIEAVVTEEDAVRVFSENGEEYIFFAPPTNQARGMRPLDGHGVFQTDPEQWRRIIQVAANHYLSDKFKSMSGAVAAVHSQLYCLRHKDGSPQLDDKGVRKLRPPGERPSYDQIYTRLKRVKSASEIYAARMGAAEYLNNKKPKPGRAQMVSLGAGDVFEIDATKFNVVVVARKNRAYVIGKAVLYLVIDRTTHLIVGMHLSLEEAQWSEACLAILSIAGDWKKLCEEFHIPYDEREWPAHERLPFSGFVADRGEGFTFDSQVICDGLDNMVTNTTSRMSSHKGIVESGFHTVDQPIAQVVPGYEPAGNVYARQPKDYDGQAVFTLRQLFGLILRRIRYHNITPLRGRKRTEDEVWADVDWSPVELWHESVKTTMGIGPRMPVALMRKKLWPVTEGEIRQDGIHFAGIAWFSDEVAEWFAFAAIAGGEAKKVTIQYDPGCIDELHVVSPIDSRRSHILPLADWCEELKGLSFNELQAHIYRVNTRRRTDKRRREEIEASQHADFKEAAEVEAEATEKAAKGMKTGTRVRLGEPARRKELVAMRQANHTMSRPISGWDDSAPTPGELEDDNELAPPESLHKTSPQRRVAKTGAARQRKQAAQEHAETSQQAQEKQSTRLGSDFGVRPELRAVMRSLLAGKNENL